MIPKIIHYTWFSGEKFPDKIKICIDSWKRLMPDWDYKLWDMEAIKNIDSIFLKEALEVHKWAYAADFVRIYALYNEGGIYLDTDALLLKQMDSFLVHNAFIGKENSIHFIGNHSAQYLSSHCMGAEKGHPFMRDCLAYFEDRHFITSKNKELPISLRYNQVLLPYIQAEIAKLYGYDCRPLTQNIQRCKKGLVIYPSNFFDATKKNKNSVCKHLALGSLREEFDKVQYNYSLSYKLKWRFIACFQWILNKFNYVTMKVE